LSPEVSAVFYSPDWVLVTLPRFTPSIKSIFYAMSLL
jgi:hypothetical protein